MEEGRGMIVLGGEGSVLSIAGRNGGRSKAFLYTHLEGSFLQRGSGRKKKI